MMRIDDNQFAKLWRETGYILGDSNLQRCPDRGEGGCIGNHCIRCAVHEIRAMLDDIKAGQ